MTEARPQETPSDGRPKAGVQRREIQFPPGRLIWESVEEPNSWGKHSCGVSIHEDVLRDSEAWGLTESTIRNKQYVPQPKQDRMMEGYVILNASSKFPVKWLDAQGEVSKIPPNPRGLDVVLHCTVTGTGLWLEAVRELPAISEGFSYAEVKPDEGEDVKITEDGLPF